MWFVEGRNATEGASHHRSSGYHDREGRDDCRPGGHNRCAEACDHCRSQASNDSRADAGDHRCSGEGGSCHDGGPCSGNHEAATRRNEGTRDNGGPEGRYDCRPEGARHHGRTARQHDRGTLISVADFARRCEHFPHFVRKLLTSSIRPVPSDREA
jgi:hypothetical protein